MAEQHFPILGTDIPPMLGRMKVMQRLWGDLTKLSPSHLSVVGPRYSGKSVLLKRLAQQMQIDDSPYGAVILWDLGHQTPISDDEFLRAMCQRIGKGIKEINADFGDHLLSIESSLYSELKEVIEALHDDGRKVLMLWDGFDRPLGAGKLTRNLWDNLRELASYPSLRLVTATRRTLHELIRSDDSATSDFWNIFDMNPVRIEPFDENDRDIILDKVKDITFHPSAKSELDNWTGGYPPLYFAVLNQIIEMRLGLEADNETVNKAAQISLTKINNVLNDLWDDCPETAKDLFRHLIDHGNILASQVGVIEKAHLVEKGFARLSGNKIIKTCRLLEHHISMIGEDTGSLVRLFGPWDEYRKNIRGMLQLRLNQFNNIDERLRRLIERSIEDIPEFPHECLSSMRGIADRVLDLIWDAEFGEDKTIPSDWIDYWERTLPRRQSGSQQNLRKIFPGNRVPNIRGHQCRLLQLITGAAERIDPKANYVSKSTYVLLNSIHQFGNFGQHLDGVDIYEGTAIAAIMSCLELASCLNKDLRNI